MFGPRLDLLIQRRPFFVVEGSTERLGSWRPDGISAARGIIVACMYMHTSGKRMLMMMMMVCEVMYSDFC